MRAFLGDEERFRKGVVLKPLSLSRIPAQHLGNRHMERHDAGLVKLRFADDEARWSLIQLDVVVLESDRFPDAESRGCQRADNGRERIWAQ